MTWITAQLAIAKLIDLAEQGEINPWDVQVIEVIDRFLRELSTPENDLPQSGQAFLWASTLVLLKANRLQDDEESDEQEIPPDLDGLPSKLNKFPSDLEQQLRRRAVAPPLKKRRVTLKELIAQIQAIAKQLEQIPSLIRSRPSKKTVANTIIHLAHEENITEMASLVEEFWRLHPHENPSTALELEQLVDLLTTKPISCDRVGLFSALLLLSAESKVELTQQEFYQDLQIKFLLTEIL